MLQEYKENVQVYGTEYWPHSGQPLTSVQQCNMPCAVCSGNRSRVLMIPANCGRESTSDT